MEARFLDRTGWVPPDPQPLVPRTWRKADLDSQIEALLTAPRGEHHRTAALHDSQLGDIGGVTPAIGVTISVLDPGEATRRHRHTCSVINYVQAGRGHSEIGGRRVPWQTGDFFVTPAWAPHVHVADPASPPVVRFAFTDAPLLRRLGILFYDDAAPEQEGDVSAAMLRGGEREERSRPVGESVGCSSAELLTYQQLIAPMVQWIEPLVWPWSEVRPRLEPMESDDDYEGRRLVLLYHPGTGVAQGTTATLFATMGLLAPGERHVPHRHTSSAVNYFTEGGRGHTYLGGRRYDWEGGDLTITPAWTIHHHANDGDSTIWGMSIHDAPLIYNTGALLWQETMRETAKILGRDVTASQTA